MPKERRQFRERERSFSGRPLGTRSIRQTFLIVCEGEKTEPNYFRGFRVPGLVVDIKGVGANTVSLVREAMQLKSGKEYDQVWCVFDRDSFPAVNFRRAMELAATQNIQVAYSNEAFELWYFLHFVYLDAALARTEYADRISQRLGVPYQKNSKSIYTALLSRQPEAIRNARKLLTQYQPVNPEKDNPSTTVHLLVEELNRFARP